MIYTKRIELTYTMGSVPLTDCVDFSHHLNRKSKARHPSPLKDIIKFMSHDGMISLAGGMFAPSRLSAWRSNR